MRVGVGVSCETVNIFSQSNTITLSPDHREKLTLSARQSDMLSLFSNTATG